MSYVTITVYMTHVSDFTVTGPSMLVQLTIDDANNDGDIDSEEWINYLQTSQGHAAGDTDPPGLYDSGKDGNLANGILYSPKKFEGGEDIEEILRQMSRQTYAPGISALNVCFLAGTRIATPKGEVRVENLRAGDLVLTRDHGPQPLVWTTQSHLGERDLDIAPDRKPIRIASGALGHGLPRRPVRVSPQHRVLVEISGKEHLISARHLMRSGAEGLSVCKGLSSFTLVHIACARHEILLAEGAPMESFYTGPMAIRALPPAALLSLLAAFPQLGHGENPMTPARPFIKQRDYQRLEAAS